jgi:tetratricopeptide (TPR) repeat protein
MPAPDPDRLLRDALAAARRAAPEPGRRPPIEAVAEAALRRGHLDLAREVLLELVEPAGRAWLHAELAARLLADNDPTGAARHLAAGQDALDLPGRWRPRGPLWMSPESAVARFAWLWAWAGDRARATALAESLVVGRSARAAAWTAVVDRVMANPEADPAEVDAAWIEARDAVLALREPVEGLRAREALAWVACRRGDAVRAASLAHLGGDHLIDAPLQRALLGEAIANVLADAGRPDAAARTWRRALRALLGAPPLGWSAAEIVCRIARQQLEHLGPDPAAETMAVAVTRAAAEPLSPDPELRFAWRLLFETGLAEPALAVPLRDHLRSQVRVPPGWCYVLGLFELATGHVQRARWAAEALDRGFEVNPADAESGWLAALLWLHTGARREGLASTQAVLAAVEPGRVAAIPGRPGGPVALDGALGEALLAAGLPEEALALARTADEPAVRADLLSLAAEHAHHEGAADAARRLSREAAVAFGALRPHLATSVWRDIAARLVPLLEDLGEPAEAGRVLEQAVRRADAAPGDLALLALTDLARELDRAGSPGADRPRAALAARVATCSNPAARAALLLQWLDVAAPAGDLGHP